jgi:hypothetical protein
LAFGATIQKDNQLLEVRLSSEDSLPRTQSLVY